MIIKRWNGSAFVEEYPKTKAQLIVNGANDDTIFDINDKIKPAFLPNSVFDSLYFQNDISSNTTLSALANQALGVATALNRSVKGFYWVASSTVTIESSTMNPDNFSGTYFFSSFRPAEEGTNIEPLSVTLEPNDWIVITAFGGSGTQMDWYGASFSVVNNTYQNATDFVDGIVRLSSRTTYASLSGSHVVTEGVLKTVIDNASFAASGHVHGNILNNGTITTNTAAATGQHLVVTSTGNLIQQSAIELGTTTTTFLNNAGGWTTPTGTYTLPAATSTVRGGIELFSDTVQTVASNSVTTTAARTYGVQVNADGQAVVNVPWSDTNTTYAKATSTVLGLVEIFDNTVQSVAANAVTTTASRTYGVQLNSADQMVVNVPWVDTNTTYTAGEGLTLSSTTFRMTNPLYVQTATPTTSVTGTIWYDIN